VNNTLVLSNNTLVAGNYPAANTAFPNLALDSQAGDVYMVGYNQRGTFVNVVSLGTDKVVRTYLLGDLSPLHSNGWMASVYDNGTGQLFVEDSWTSNVSVLWVANGTLASNISVGDYPISATYDNGTGEVYVVDYLGNSLSVIADANDTVVATIPVPVYPDSVAYDYGTHQIFVGGPYTDSIDVISDANHTVVDTIPIGGGLNGLAYDPRVGEVFFASGSRVGIISDHTDQIVGNITISYSTGPIAVDTGSGEVYVCGLGNSQNELAVFSDGNDSVVVTIPVGSFPAALVYDEVTDEIVTDIANDQYLLVTSGHTHEPVAEVSLGTSPSAIADDPGSGRLFLSTPGVNGSGNVSILWDATNTITGNVSLNASPRELAFIPGHDEFVGLLWSGTGSNGSDEVAVISASTGRVLQNISVGLAPSGAAYDPTTDEIWVTNAWSSNISVISASNDSVVGQISLPGAWPAAITFDAASQQFFVVSQALGSVMALDAGNWTTSATIRFGSEGNCAVTPTILYANGTGSIFVSGLWSPCSSPGSVDVLSDVSDTLIANLTAGESPGAMAYDPTTGEVLVANELSADVTLIAVSNLSVIGSVQVGTEPVGVAWDPLSGDVYVTNSEQGTVSILSYGSGPLYSVQFRETGLSIGTGWSVTLSGSTLSSFSSNLSFQLPNGTYGFHVVPIPGLGVTPSAGTLNVTGAPVIVSVAFSTLPSYTYAVWFNASGIPSGTNWSVRLANALQTTSKSSLTFNEANGSYGYVVGTVFGFSSAPSNGSLNVSGVDQTVAIRFTNASNTSQAPGPLRIVSFDVTPISLEVGASIAISVRTMGGTGSLHFAYTGFPAGCIPPDQASWGCVPAVPGSSAVQVVVTDAAGHTAAATGSFTVNQAPLTPAPLSPATYAIALGLIGVLVLIALLAFRGRRAGRKMPEGSGSAGGGDR
jgi:YVTN family beta-propeller protein